MDIGRLESSIHRIQEDLGKDNERALLESRSEIESVIAALDEGKIRVCEERNGEWITHAWIKEAILLYFRVMEMKEWKIGPFTYFDKIPLKTNFAQLKVRAVPPATARYGSFMENGVVLMPSYVNIGAYVGRNTMVDTWATVGSCAQIGAGVHLSGGVGIGGVLEPANARPVIIEDGCFIGSRCIVVEGVRVGKEAVLAANVTITSSTPIIDARTSEIKETKGFVPARAVVISGTKEKTIAGGKIFTACCYIIGERKPATNLKLSLNDTLREFALSV